MAVNCCDVRRLDSHLLDSMLATGSSVFSHRWNTSMNSFLLQTNKVSFLTLCDTVIICNCQMHDLSLKSMIKCEILHIKQHALKLPRLCDKQGSCSGHSIISYFYSLHLVIGSLHPKQIVLWSSLNYISVRYSSYCANQWSD